MKVLMKSKNSCSSVPERMYLEKRRMWLMNEIYELVILEAGQFLGMTRFLERDNSSAAKRQKMVRIGTKVIFIH